MSSIRWIRIFVPLVLTVCTQVLSADEPVDVDRYVAVVLRSHPATAQVTGLQAAAAAEKKAARLFPDPVFEYSRGQARPREGIGSTRTETAYSARQTIPWPGTFSAGGRAGDRAADALLAQAEGVRWELEVLARSTFASAVAARAVLAVARGSEEDARSLRDLVTRRAELGESRESDRIKAEVEWLRQQRSLAAAEREAAAIEAILRALATEPLPTPLDLSVSKAPPLPPIDLEALRARLAHNPRQRAALAEAERQQALLAVAQKARIPDLDVTVFRDTELDKQAHGFSLGIKVPLWNANRGEIARAQAAAQVTAAEAQRVRVELVAELEGRIKELEIASGQVALLEGKILPAATQSVGLARFSYEEGETSLLDLLDAQRTYRDTQREAADADLTRALALAEVQRLLGPDFSPWSSR